MSTWSAGSTPSSTADSRQCGPFLRMLLAAMIMLVTIRAAEAEGRGFAVPLKRDITESTENPKTDDTSVALSNHFRALRHVRRKYEPWGNPGPEVDEHSTLQEIYSSLQRRDGGATAIAPGGGPKVGTDVWGAVPPKFPNSLGVDQDGNDFAYFAFIQIGSTKNPFKLLLDTGSSHTWIPGSGCTAGACGVMKQLTTAISPTLETTSKSFYIQYGSGAVVGSAAFDIFNFAGFTIVAEFGLANKVSDNFKDFTIDGVLGLGPAIKPSSGSGNNVTSIMEILVQQKAIEKKIYGVALGRASDGVNDGVINFGNLDPAMYEGELGYVEVKKETGLWQVPIGGVKVGDISLELEGEQRTAIVDTGTTLFFAPTQDAIRLHAAIPDSQIIGTNFIIPCKTEIGISITFGSGSYNIPPIDFLGPPIAAGSEYCLSLIGPREFLGTSTWLLGAVFLKSVYSVFDLDAHRVGFAQRKLPRSSTNFGRKPWTTLNAQYMTPVASMTATRGLSPTGVVVDRVNGESGGGDKSSGSGRTTFVEIRGWWLVLTAVVMGLCFMG